MNKFKISEEFEEAVKANDFNRGREWCKQKIAEKNHFEEWCIQKIAEHSKEIQS